MEQIFQQAISLTGSFNLWLILTIFMITTMAEFGLGIPYLLETIWLLVGYHAIGGAISPVSILVFCIISLGGREIGATMLYKVSGSRINPLSRLIQRITFLENLESHPENPLKRYVLLPLRKRMVRALSPTMISPDGEHKEYLLEKYVRFSPLNVALGRFSWLKIPITITMGMTRRPLVLLTGVALFSMTWDGLYISLGAFSGGDKVSPVVMLACTVSGFILINIAVFFFRRYWNSRKLRKAG